MPWEVKMDVPRAICRAKALDILTRDLGVTLGANNVSQSPEAMQVAADEMDRLALMAAYMGDRLHDIEVGLGPFEDGS